MRQPCTPTETPNSKPSMAGATFTAKSKNRDKNKPTIKELSWKSKISWLNIKNKWPWSDKS